jgi:predicted CopG family antitoxin
MGENKNNNKTNAMDTSKTIRISQEHYDELISLGRMHTSFDDVLGDVLKQARIKASAAAAKEDDE